MKKCDYFKNKPDWQKPFQIGDKVVKITIPPLHTHKYNDGEVRLCDRVICPEGYVGIEVVGNIYEDSYLLNE